MYDHASSDVKNKRTLKFDYGGLISFRDHQHGLERYLRWKFY